MRQLAIACTACLLVAPSPLLARARSHHHLFGGGGYVGASGRNVRSPSRSLLAAALGSSAKCRDGSHSFSRHSSGTCSGHGGVAAFR